MWDLNPQPSAHKTDALTNCANRANWECYHPWFRNKRNLKSLQDEKNTICGDRTHGLQLKRLALYRTELIWQKGKKALKFLLILLYSIPFKLFCGLLNIYQAKFCKSIFFFFSFFFFLFLFFFFIFYLFNKSQLKINVLNFFILVDFKFSHSFSDDGGRFSKRKISDFYIILCVL